jgi:hemoglobin
MSVKDIQSDKDVELLVHMFYGKVQDDKRLDYIFNDFAEINWDHHLPRMVDFWSNLLFQTGRYKGRPYRQHTHLPIEKEDFGRWMNLFESTVDELFHGERADYAKEMAAKIASSFALRMEMDGKFN